MSSINGGSSFGASPSGWAVELVHPSGYVHTPAVMDKPSPERNPVANGMPTITVPVKRNEKWSHPDFEDAEMRVWHDGERQPVDRVEEIQQTESATVLKGRGGLELEKRAQAEVTQQRTTAFVEGLITETTGYTANVDSPETTRENGVRLDGATRDGHFTTRLDPDRTDPVRIGDGAVKLAQSCYPTDALRADWILLNTLGGDQYNRGEVVLLEDDDDYIRFSFETEYDIPAEAVGIKLRDEVFGASSIEVTWDGALISRIEPPNDLGWREVGAFSGTAGVPDYQAAVGAPIRAGETHELEFRAHGPSQHGIDAVALYDRRYDYSWPNPGPSNGGGILSGPELYPSSYNLRFDAPTPGRAVVGGRLTVSGRGGGSGIARIGLSNTQGEGYGIESDTDEYEVDFQEPGPSLRPLVTLARTGDNPNRNTIPTTGFESQWLRSYTLSADLEDIPLVVNQSFDDSLVNVLRDVAEGANAVFEYQRGGSTESIEWTQPGTRTADRAPKVGSYQTTKSTANRVEKAVVYGATRDIDGEVIVILGGQAGKTVDLTHSRIQQGTLSIESYYTGATMDEGPDYAVDYQAGVVDTKASGRMDANTEYRVSYSYQTYGEYANPAIDSPRETVEESTVTSGFAAQQVARTIVRELQTPLERGTLSISGEAGYSVVEALAAADLPGGTAGDIQIREVTSRPGGTDLRLGSRRSVNEIIGDIERNISAVTRQV